MANPNLSPALRASLGVIGLVGDDVADAAAGIGHVAGIPWNQVDVEVEYGLAGRCAAVDADIVTVGSVVFVDHGFGIVRRVQERGPLTVICVEPGRYVAVRN
jgi:hypothetical protein